MRAGARSAGLSGSPTSVGSCRVPPGNELGNWLGDIALAVVVFDRTGSALATAGLFLAARFAPALVAPAVATWLEPRRRSGLAGAYAAEAAVFACLALAVAHGAPLGVLLVLAGVDGALPPAARSLGAVRTAALFPDGARLRGPTPRSTWA